MRRPWTDDEDETVRINYANWPCWLIAHLVDRSERAVYMRAAQLGLQKSEDFYSGLFSTRLRQDDPRGAQTRFAKGHVPANKGVKRGRGWAPGRMAAGQFKRGQLPHTWNPLGHERVTQDGYLEIKVRDTRCTRQDYAAAHRLVWEREVGPIPAGHAVVFKPGTRTTTFRDITLDRLECIPRAELMRRNTIHRFPPELREVMQLTGALKRKINRRQTDAQRRA